MPYYLKGCPKCGGDRYKESDLFSGVEVVCFQCGNRTTIEPPRLPVIIRGRRKGPARREFEEIDEILALI